MSLCPLDTSEEAWAIIEDRIRRMTPREQVEGLGVRWAVGGSLASAADIFVPAPGPMGIGQLDRCRVMDVLLTAPPFPVLSAEDIVLQKLRWYAVGGEVSDKQWRDIVSVLRFGGSDIDQGYLDSVAQVAGLADLLARARKDAS